jgi:hypothetical protein
MIADEPEAESGPGPAIAHRGQPAAVLAPSPRLRGSRRDSSIAGTLVEHHLDTRHSLEPLAQVPVELRMLALHDDEPARPVHVALPGHGSMHAAYRPSTVR